jgi:DNA-binding HxlR family transcriptional regulator
MDVRQVRKVREIILKLNKVFDNRIRLAVMSALTVNESLDFNTLKLMLDVTDGNLASHISALEQEGYVRVTKTFVGKKPRTSYALTAAGKKAFQEHIDALERLIWGTSPRSSQSG